jgi:hypothetical protein
MRVPFVGKRRITMAKHYGPQVPDQWTAKEKQVFRQLGIGDGEVALRRLIRGQRRINGKLYDSIDLIIAHLKKQAGSKGLSAALKKAEKLNDQVPSADPPKCESGGGGTP